MGQGLGQVRASSPSAAQPIASRTTLGMLQHRSSLHARTSSILPPPAAASTHLLRGWRLGLGVEGKGGGGVR